MVYAINSMLQLVLKVRAVSNMAVDGFRDVVRPERS